MQQLLDKQQTHELESIGILTDWCKSKGYDYSLTIGQMIEYLQEQRGIADIQGPVMSKSGNEWSISLLNPKSIIAGYTITGVDLCGMLWEEVKTLSSYIGK